MRPPARSTVRVLGLVLTLLAIAGCGDDGDSTGPNVNAPVLSNLSVVPLGPERANTTVPYVATVSFTDTPGDVGNGTCEFSSANLTPSTVSGPITVPPGTSPDLTQGVVSCGFTVTVFAPAQVNVSMTVIDRAGNRSNSLSFVLGISQLAEVPSGRAPAAPGLGGGSATLGGTR